MKNKTERSDKLRELLRAAHRERDHCKVDPHWRQRTLGRIRHQAAAGRPMPAERFLETYYWRWFAAGGLASALLTAALLNFQFIPDADMWSFLLYENETLTMLQAFLY